MSLLVNAAIRLSILALLAAPVGAAVAASPGKRIALVIGNSDYARIGALANPTADGALIARSLERLNFETTLLLDASQISMKQAIAAFGRELRVGGRDSVGLFYYAGHGVQAGGRNYLMPVEADPQDEADLDLYGVEVNWVLRQMEAANNRANILILDACRNNPLAAKNRSAARGLAQMEAPIGSFIAYATAPGETAADGDGANSPFSAALAKQLEQPNRPVERIFKSVRVDVIKATKGRQTPWDASSLVDDFFFQAPTPRAAPVAAATPNPTPPNPTPAEASLWQSVSETGDPGRLALFLQLFPQSAFAPDAKARMMQLMLDEAKPAPVAERKASEHEMIAAAQQSGSTADYNAYLAAYPDGVFADLARAEVEHLVRSSATAQATASGRSAPAAPTAPQTDDDAVLLAALTFDQPIPKTANGWTPGVSLRDLARAEPDYPPVKGLDPKVWRDKKCSSCHNWTIENLCKQGKFYAGADKAALARTPHPYGGGFKSALYHWAKGGCR